LAAAALSQIVGALLAFCEGATLFDKLAELGRIGRNAERLLEEYASSQDSVTASFQMHYNRTCVCQLEGSNE